MSHSFIVPQEAVRPTLSLMVKTVSAGPGDKLGVFIGEGIGMEQENYFPLGQPSDGWVHVWLDVSAFKVFAYPIMMRFVLSGKGEREVYIDEVSLGDPAPGSRPVFVPLLRR